MIEVLPADGLVIVAKHECHTCVLVEPVMRSLDKAGALTVITQDDPAFPSGVGRVLDPDNDRLFTWWPPWRNLRARNIGWRTMLRHCARRAGRLSADAPARSASLPRKTTVTTPISPGPQNPTRQPQAATAAPTTSRLVCC